MFLQLHITVDCNKYDVYQGDWCNENKYDVYQDDWYNKKYDVYQDDWYIETTKPPRSWPDEGKVAIENYSTRYREGLDLVIKGVTANIGSGEKVGL